MESLKACALCGAEPGRFRPYGKRGGYSVARCGDCGLVFVNPRDDSETVARQYREGETSPLGYYEATAPVDAINFNRALDWIETRKAKGRLFDIGCNAGTFLGCARRRGWDVAGIDANGRAVEFCRKKGLNVIHGFFDAASVGSLRKNDFDLVSMNDAIEHFPDPLEALRLARRLLKPAGLIAVTTPNIASFLARLFQIKPKEHLFYFDKGTLSRMLEAAGLKVEMAVETGKRRDVGSMHLGATFENRRWLLLSRFLKAVRLDRAAALFLERMFDEELFALARAS